MRIFEGYFNFIKKKSKYIFNQRDSSHTSHSDGFFHILKMDCI